MLEHMTKANRANSILRSVNEPAGVFHCRLDNESRGVASLGRTGVVGTRVSTLCFDVWNGAVLSLISFTASGCERYLLQ